MFGSSGLIDPGTDDNMSNRYEDESGKGRIVSEWMAIAQWHECERLTRPGIVFEIQNAEGLSLFTPCTPTIPQMPFDWKSPPVRFRAVLQERPRHSEPIPAPKR
jgi:hypothetical protein